MSTVWRTSKNSQKKKRVAQKPKIRWQELGFSDSGETRTSISIEDIRREIVVMSSRGLGQGARSRHTLTEAKPPETRVKKRRGATE